jgi:hypothetical protein
MTADKNAASRLRKSSVSFDRKSYLCCSISSFRIAELSSTLRAWSATNVEVECGVFEYIGEGESKKRWCAILCNYLQETRAPSKLRLKSTDDDNYSSCLTLHPEI